ncbi:lipase family protein [Streptomyces sp. NBC_00536]|uniref:lipase family protein n=1 Tax=Streptomyces sp. NBC_00536 TaxID=2975769 RepID=UPI002E800893|nr:lipase family protein [Streptomyces sp. NBC_00536]WUC77414.1 lipase family protein [Streptomyces sp. NBC_00536]
MTHGQSHLPGTIRTLPLPPSAPPGPRGGPGRRAAALVRASRWAVAGAILAALALSGCSRAGDGRVPDRPAASTPVPEGDAFYDPPKPLPPGKPGTVIRQRPYAPPESTLTVPSHTFLVMYLSTGTDGKPVAASGLVSVPDGPAPAGGRPVAAVDHGTMGIGSTCSPSRMPAFAGLADTSPVAKLLARGFVVAQPDYIGLGVTGVRHPYLGGKSAAYATLDILRAAHRIDPGAAATTLVYGGSQGGHAALWTAHYAAGYAPEVDLKGVVANAPAVGFEWMPALFAQQSPVATPYAGMLLTLIDGASAADPAVKPAALLTPDALAAADRMWTEPCMSGETVVPAPADILRPGADLGPLNATLKASAANEATTKVPVLLPQGGNDVLSNLNRTLARELCDKGVPLEFTYYPDQGHTISDAPLDDAIAWMDARRAGTPVAASCAF